MPVSFTCTCSKERFGNAIIGLGEEEIQEMIEEDGKAEAHCHFCNEKYQYSKEELEGLSKGIKVIMIKYSEKSEFPHLLK